MMKRIFQLMVVSVLILSVTGCAVTTWSRMTKPVYRDGARDFEAEVPVDWMRFNLVKYFLITKDGTVLNMIGVERFKFNKKLEFTKKVFEESMTPSELAEVEIDNMRANGDIDKFEVISNQPQTLDGRPAFRIEYTYVTTGGLETRGIHLGFIEDKWVYRIRYQAAEQHYFKATRPAFDRFIETFKLL